MRLCPPLKQIVVWTGTVHSSIEHPDPAYWDAPNQEVRRTFHALCRAERRWLQSIYRNDAALARRWQRTTARWQSRYHEAHRKLWVHSGRRTAFVPPGDDAMSVPAMKHPHITHRRWRAVFLRELP